MGNTIVQDTGIDGESASSSGCVAGATRRDSDDWITIPIFVSSHFKDFHAEREILVKQVLPDLCEWCERRQIHLVQFDVRWHMPKDKISQDSLHKCLATLEKQQNIAPLFLNITSDNSTLLMGLGSPPGTSNEIRWSSGLSDVEINILKHLYSTKYANSLFMARSSNFLKNLPSEFKDDFTDSHSIPKHKINLLKDVLRTKLDERIQWYECEFAGVDNDGKLEFIDLQDNFYVPVLQFFKDRIERQYPDAVPLSFDSNQLQKSHKIFARTRGAVVLGRNAIFEKLKNYITDDDIDYPLVVLGHAGSGKSAILARTANVASIMAAQDRIPGGGESGWHVFYHFVGAVPGSTDVEKCLKRLLTEINAVNEASMPRNLELTCQTTCSILSHPNTKPVIVIVDGLNQFDDDRAATTLSWLPRKLAPHIRVIISMIHDTPPHRSMKERGYSPKEIFVTPLDSKSREDIVAEMLSQHNKHLDCEQMNNLLAKESSQNPLWLAVACEELRVYDVYERMNDKINALADGLLEILEQVFDRFEAENGGRLLIATLCLLETSSAGLLESELLQILGDEDNLMPESEDSSCKDRGKSEKSEKDMDDLSADKWSLVYRALRPFLRPFGDSREGRLDFYHRAVSKAVRKKYLNGEDKEMERLWWHGKLADYFYKSNNLKRKVEELPCHLVETRDKSKLLKTITDWRVFDMLYNDEYCALLMKYWREGFGEDWQAVLRDAYQEAITKDETDMTDDEISARCEQVSRILMHAGKHDDSFVFLERAMSIEKRLEENVGNRDERLGELYDLAACIFDDKLKLYQFIEPFQLVELRIALSYARKSIAIRETLSGNLHKYKLGKTLMQLAFNLEAWMETGADNDLPGEEAVQQGKEYINRAIDIFTELGEYGMLADATMTKGILEPRGCEKQLEICMAALEQCLQAYGENSVLTSRLYLNIGIFHEDNRRYKIACEWFIKWKTVCEEVFGYHHPKTKRARETLKRPRYMRIIMEELQNQLQEQMSLNQHEEASQ